MTFRTGFRHEPVSFHLRMTNESSTLQSPTPLQSFRAKFKYTILTTAIHKPAQAMTEQRLQFKRATPSRNCNLILNARQVYSFHRSLYVHHTTTAHIQDFTGTAYSNSSNACPMFLLYSVPPATLQQVWHLPFFVTVGVYISY